MRSSTPRRSVLHKPSLKREFTTRLLRYYESNDDVPFHSWLKDNAIGRCQAASPLRNHDARTQTEPRRRAELRVTIQRVSGDAMTADLLLSEIEASLGDAWRLDVLEERNGTARIRVVLMGSDASGMKNKCCSKKLIQHIK